MKAKAGSTGSVQSKTINSSARLTKTTSLIISISTDSSRFSITTSNNRSNASDALEMILSPEPPTGE